MDTRKVVSRISLVAIIVILTIAITVPVYDHFRACVPQTPTPTAMSTPTRIPTSSPTLTPTATSSPTRTLTNTPPPAQTTSTPVYCQARLEERIDWGDMEIVTLPHNSFLQVTVFHNWSWQPGSDKTQSWENVFWGGKFYPHGELGPWVVANPAEIHMMCPDEKWGGGLDVRPGDLVEIEKGYGDHPYYKELSWWSIEGETPDEWFRVLNQEVVKFFLENEYSRYTTSDPIPCGDRTYYLDEGAFVIQIPILVPAKETLELSNGGDLMFGGYIIRTQSGLELKCGLDDKKYTVLTDKTDQLLLWSFDPDDPWIFIEALTITPNGVRNY